MANSGIWEGKPFADDSLAKTFKKDFMQFVSENQYRIQPDRLANAFISVNEAKKAAVSNIKVLIENQIFLTERLLPEAEDVGAETKQVIETAKEIHIEEKKRNKNLWCYLFACGSSCLTIVAVILFLTFGHLWFPKERIVISKVV